MKKICVLFVIFVLPMITSAQKNFEKLAEMYKDKKGITVVQLEKDLIDLYKKDNLDKESIEVLKTIDRVNILTASTYSGDNNSVENHLDAVNKCFALDKYKLIKSRVDKWSFAKVYIKKEGDKVSELLVINSARETTFTLIMLGGKFKLSNLNKLSKALNINGLECLNELNTSNSMPVYINSNKNSKYYKNIEKESKELKDKIKSIKINKGDFNEESFEEAMERFGESMEKWGESLGKNIEKVIENLEQQLEDIDDNTIVDDNNYSVTIGKKGKATIHLSPDDNSVCIIDGKKVSNSKIENLNSGDINRIRIVKLDHKNNEKFMVITTNKKIGSVKLLNKESLEFSHNGKTYKYNLNEKNFPGFIVNGKKAKSLQNINTKDILQIRIISEDEKKAFNDSANRIIIEIK